MNHKTRPQLFDASHEDAFFMYLGRQLKINIAHNPFLPWYVIGTSLVRHLTLPVHISSSNGLMDMIGSEKVFADVLAMRFNMFIGQLLAEISLYGRIPEISGKDGFW